MYTVTDMVADCSPAQYKKLVKDSFDAQEVRFNLDLEEVFTSSGLKKAKSLTACVREVIRAVERGLKEARKFQASDLKPGAGIKYLRAHRNFLDACIASMESMEK
jgi:hypothetical protein